MNVYFIQSGTKGHVKIGVANDVAGRLRTMQTGCPEELSLILEIRCKGRAHAFELERLLHKRFGWARVRGEWFSRKIKGRIEQMREIPKECIIRHDLNK